MKDKISAVLKKIVGADTAFEIFIPEKENLGHYSTNVALQIAKTEKKKPIELARELVRKIQKASPKDLFEKVEAAEPGFINFWLSQKTLEEELSSIQKSLKNYGRSSLGKGKTIIVEYSQPNIAKMMHVGHLRTTIIGDALANIFEFLGYKVVRWNYLGDWGTQFGKLIAAYKLWGDKAKMETNPIEELQNLYVRFHDEAKQKPELHKLGQEEFKKLEEGDKENKKLWEWFKKESLKEFEKIYQILDVKFDTYIGESFFDKEMRPLTKELLQKGIAKKSEGAVIIPLEKFNLPPALIEKSDEASLYLSRDIANLRYRLKKFKPVKILYVVGNEQSLHFEQLFAVAKILGMNKAELIHVKYGLVLGEEGKKLATREGRAILLNDVLEKGIRLARKVVEEKNPELSDKEKDSIAEVVGIGALKYNDLKENRNSDIVFNWKKMLDLTGDSAPYLQYTYARLMSIVRKSPARNRQAQALAGGQIANGKAKKSGNYDIGLLGKEIELKLIRKIIEFPDKVLRSAKDLSTSNLANYLYKLATVVNQLYESTPVIKEKNELRRNALLVFIETAASVIKSGLGLLGIKAPKKI